MVPGGSSGSVVGKLVDTLCFMGCTVVILCAFCGGVYQKCVHCLVANNMLRIIAGVCSYEEAKGIHLAKLRSFRTVSGCVMLMVGTDAQWQKNDSTGCWPRTEHSPAV